MECVSETEEGRPCAVEDAVALSTAAVSKVTGTVVQASSLLASFLMFILINITHVFRS